MSSPSALSLTSCLSLLQVFTVLKMSKFNTGFRFTPNVLQAQDKNGQKLQISDSQGEFFYDVAVSYPPIDTMKA